jgi:hypothetical protein
MLSLFETDQIHGWATRLHRLQTKIPSLFWCHRGAISTGVPYSMGPRRLSPR